MIITENQLRIFIASPSDCILERKAVRQLCTKDKSILTICSKNNISLDTFVYEDVCSGLGRPQSLINKAVEKFNPDWFVFIFWHRFGSDAGLGMTGTEEEWNLARQLWEKGSGHPRVSIYFNKKSVSPYEIDEQQLEALKLFQSKVFGEYQGLACFFNGVRDFENKFRAHLTEHLLNLGEDRHEFTIERLQQELIFSSNVLLNYHRTLDNNQYIERAEFCEVIQRIVELPHSTSIILGSPGSGKSSLLSTLAHSLNDNSVPIIAIKADTLTTDINTAEGLQKALGLSLDVRDSILALAEINKVVLIVDQLDAVSELLDRKSGRLNVLLNLIQTLSGHNGVHIIASSREFEFYNDVRLNSINAEKITLELPAWEQIAPILEQTGHETNNISEILIELLRTPLHLKIFLDVASLGAFFPSLHALLEELWKQKVLAPQAPRECLELLNKLSKRMSEEESLWVPASCADEFPEARLFLEHNDILQRSQVNTTIGFRHQTYYDFALTRAFASGPIPFSDYVFERQDGLFVRPTFLSCLHYLRATSISEYQKQLQIFFKDGLRPHLFSLLIEFLGAQKQPDNVEAYLMLPLLESDTEGPKVFNAVIGSPGWFDHLSRHECLADWMKKPPELAQHCVPFLAAAASFSGITVFDLLKRYWLSDDTYDSLTLRVLLDFKEWNVHTVTVAETLVKRSEYWTAGMLVERIAELKPDLAPRVLRSRLDRMLDEAIEIYETKKPAAALHEDVQFMASTLLLDDTLDRLVETTVDFIDIERLAQQAPKPYLEWIWPWFLNVANQIASEEHEFIMQYSDFSTISHPDRNQKGTILTGLFVAVRKLAETDLHSFLEFFDENTDSDLLVVHRTLAHGLTQIASINPNKVLEYILGDPRRLSIGDHNDCHRDSKQLIACIFPHLEQSDKLRLEEAVISFKRYKRVMPEWEVDVRRRRFIWNRQHRLRILRAFPEEHISQKIRRLKLEEKRAFPILPDHDGSFSGGFIGPRLKAEEMSRASDRDLMNLFEHLSDETQWDNPKRREREDYSRGGGSIQQSREFKNFAKGSPKRAIRMLNDLKPGRHEVYAGAGLEGLEESGLPPDEIISLVKSIDKRGFSSGTFREGAASALERLAVRANGLPDGVLSLLEKWLSEHPEPKWPDESEPKEEKNEDIKDSILFGTRGFVILPHGRGTILRAIIAGLLQRKPPAYITWAGVIESRLDCEHHPNVWALTLMHMPILFNGKSEEATRMFDIVIRTYPQVLEKRAALYSIARVMRMCRPIEVIQEWLEKIKACSSGFNKQVYGEMLFLYHCHHRDSWSVSCIRDILSDEDESILLGLACGASRLWHELDEHAMAKEVLCQLASHHDKSIQQAVANVFRYNNQDHFQINSDIKAVIEAVCANPKMLLKAAPDLVELLIDYIGTEPKLVSDVCQNVIRAGGSDIGNISTSLALLAEPLTSIALTLHRHTEYREVGLEMFESLLSLNVRETRTALDILDRKPYKTLPVSSYRRRRRRRKRQDI